MKIEDNLFKQKKKRRKFYINRLFQLIIENFNLLDKKEFKCRKQHARWLISNTVNIDTTPAGSS